MSVPLWLGQKHSERNDLLNLQSPEQAQQVADGHLRSLRHLDNISYHLRIEGDAPSGPSEADQCMCSWRQMTPQIRDFEGILWLMLHPHGGIHSAKGPEFGGKTIFPKI